MEKKVSTGISRWIGFFVAPIFIRENSPNEIGGAASESNAWRAFANSERHRP